MRWEYKAIVLQISSPIPLTNVLNDIGEERWELIQCDLAENMFVFKRPKQELVINQDASLLSGHVKKP
jgi:hypothetical protein